MDYTITLTIPEVMYRDVEQQATRSQLTIEAILSQRLRELWQTNGLAEKESEPLTAEEQMMAQEVEAYQSIHAELVKHYLGQYVAIYQGKLVDHDWDEDALMQRRLQNYPDAVVMVDKVEAEPQQELHIPSLRWIQS